MHYLAVESGTHELPDGTRILASTVSTTSQQHGSGVTGSESWHTEAFASWPGTTSSPLSDSQVMAYDANGNPSSLTEDSTLYSYSVLTNSNRLQSTAGPVAKTYGYDLAGNISSDGLHTYGYDDRGRLVDVDSGSVTYVHNGQGQRVKKDNGAATLFAYDESGTLLGEYDSLGSAVQETVWFNGMPIGVLQGSNIYHVHTDHLGSPRAISDGNTVIWRWQSDPFGSTAPDENPDGDATPFTYNLRFAGQYFDVETGLRYNYYRTYDPSTGRYLESDPIGLAAGLNTYAYVGNMPTTYVDPFGLETCILVTRNSSGFGNHAALWSDGSSSTGGPFLYDPAGSYVPSKEQQGDFTSGTYADMDAFEEFHRNTYDDSTERACMDTTDEEEEKIFSNILNRNQCSGMFCASCVSSVLTGVPSFNGVGSLFPGNLPGQVNRNRMPPPKLWEKPTAP